MKPAPIILESATEEYLRRHLANTKEGMEPALIWTPTQEVSDPESGDRSTYEGPAVTLGWYRKGQLPRDSFYEFCGFSVSIMPSTLEHITGKTIHSEAIESKIAKGPPYWHVLKVS